MIIELAETYQVDVKRSFMVGDMVTDIQAGKSAGCMAVLLGKTDGYGLIDFARELQLLE